MLAFARAQWDRDSAEMLTATVASMIGLGVGFAPDPAPAAVTDSFEIATHRQIGSHNLRPDETGLANHLPVENPYPAIETALKTQRMFHYTPQEAVGRGGFELVDNVLVHGPSGMTCDAQHTLLTEEDGLVSTLTLLSVTLYGGEDTDVSCRYGGEQQAVTIFASYWPGLALEDHFIRSRTIMMQYETPFGSAVDVPVTETDDGSAERLAFAYDGQRNGTEVREGLWLAMPRGWHVKLRATHAPPSDVELLFASILHHVATHEVATGTGTPDGAVVQRPVPPVVMDAGYVPPALPWRGDDKPLR